MRTRNQYQFKLSSIRFSTLDAICRVLECQTGDILEFQEDG